MMEPLSCSVPLVHPHKIIQIKFEDKEDYGLFQFPES